MIQNWKLESKWQRSLSPHARIFRREGKFSLAHASTFKSSEWKGYGGKFSLALLLWTAQEPEMNYPKEPNHYLFMYLFFAPFLPHFPPLDEEHSPCLLVNVLTTSRISLQPLERGRRVLWRPCLTQKIAGAPFPRSKDRGVLVVAPLWYPPDLFGMQRWRKLPPCDGISFCDVRHRFDRHSWSVQTCITDQPHALLFLYSHLYAYCMREKLEIYRVSKRSLPAF